MGLLLRYGNGVHVGELTTMALVPQIVIYILTCYCRRRNL